MPNVMGREFPYTPQGMAEAEQYRQAVGMRGGGMMGFRPLGYADGELVESVAAADARSGSEFAGPPADVFRYTSEDRAAAIDLLMDFLNMRDPTPLLDMSDEDLRDAVAIHQGRIESEQAVNLGRSVGDPTFSNRDIAGMKQMIDNSGRGAVELLDTDIYPDDSVPAYMYPVRPYGPEEYDRYGQDMADRQWVEGSTGAYEALNPTEMNRGGIMSLRGY